MIIRFVCLANSLKEGGRCLAGIMLNENNDPIVDKNGPKWIRPIAKLQYGKLFTHWVSHITLLDIVETEVIGFSEKSTYQTENALIIGESFKVIQKFDLKSLHSFCDDRHLIFASRGKAISEEAIAGLDHSLIILKTQDFQIIKKTYEDTPGKTQLRLSFWHYGINYDFPITDPVFLENYQRNATLPWEGKKEIFLCISLGIAFKGWYYKLVAGILY